MKFWRRPGPLGLVFILTGALHFLVLDYYVRIIPPFLPHARGLVYLSGLRRCSVEWGSCEDAGDTLPGSA